jgi:PAS domain S-box-containing protein
MAQKAASISFRQPWASLSEPVRFAVAAGGGAVALLLIAAAVGLQIGGETAAERADDISVAVFAMLAALSCFVAARRSVARRRLAWSLLGSSAFIWGIGGAITAFYDLVLASPAPVPSIADPVYLASYPLAVAAVMAVPTAPSTMSTRGRAVIDAGIIASALVFMALAVGLGSVYRSSVQSTGTDLITLARPFGDVIVLTVLIPAALRGVTGRRGRLLLLLGGFSTIAFSDFAYAILVASGTPHGQTELFDIGWVSGFILIGLAPLWPLRAENASTQERPASLWQVAVPLLSLVLVATTTLVVTGTGRKMDVWISFPGAALGILLTVSQLLTHRDSLALLSRSRRTEAQLSERTAFLNQVIGHTPAGLARISRELRITDPNPRLCTIFRAPSRVIVGSSLTDYVPEADVKRVFDAIPPLSNEIDSVEADSEAVRADGSKLWVHWSATPVRNARGGIEYILAMFDDVTSEHEADAAALANLASLERLSKLKSEFVTMVSHEFRTALTGIQGYSEVMRDDTVTPEEVKEFAGDINTDAERLSRMITEMLDLDRMEAGRMKLNLGPVDVNALLSDAAGRARVASSEHRVTVALGSGIPTIAGDSDRIFQVVANLLSNAIKYSPAGGEVEVSSSLEGGYVKVSVRDQGPGIAPEFIDRLFGRYERYEGNPRSGVIGTGLGLAIARQIVEMHRGRIWVESTLGEGSRFLFTIPVEGGLPVAPATQEAKT